MLLAIDVGNTNITFAVFDKDQIKADWRIGTVSLRTEDEYAVILTGLMEKDSISPEVIDGIAISSVVPAVNYPLMKLAKQLYGVSDPLMLSADTVGIEVRYSPRTDVGADRLANAIAAHELYTGPVIVVDFGTATTFDAVGADGSYLGGAIAPGIETSMQALVSKASQLRRIEYISPPSAIGTSTVASLQSGVFYGFAGQVDRIVEQFCGELGGSAHVVATGGLAELIAPASRTIDEINPFLTLIGLRLVFERQSKGQ